jgi:replicative DNA helicase
MSVTKFNPANFVHTAKQTWHLKEEYDKFIQENEHLAEPFHITGLEDILPRILPGETVVHFAKSHHGKSTAMRNAQFKAQLRIQDTDFMIGVVSLEDSAESNAAKIVQRYKGNSMEFMDDQMLFIGNHFGMSSEDMGKLNVDNIIASLDYGLEMLPGKKGYSDIYVDYAQIVADSDNVKNSDQRRLQIIYTVRRLFDASKHFRCPVHFAAQALLKQQKDGYTSVMRIPGAADLKEAGELYEIPDVAIAYWQPKHESNTPIGTKIDDGAWSFTVESNLIFIRIAKWRNAELKGFVGKKDVVGRVFPCWIQEDGEIVYDKKRHQHMVMTSIEEKEG